MRRTHMTGASGALLAALFAGHLTACSSAGDGESAGLEGELVVYGGVQRDGQKVVRYALQRGDARIPLEFSEPPSVQAGAKLRVRGEAAGARGVRVIDFDMVEPEDGLGRVQQPLSALGEPSVRSAAVIMVHWGQPDGATPESVRTDLLTSETSANALFEESSYGLLGFEGDVFGWYQIPEPTGCNVGTMATDGEAAARAAGVPVDDYDHLLFYFPGRSDCNFGGLGEVGTPASPARRTWYNGWHAPFVLSHELGHNLGFWHAHSYSCTSTLRPRENCSYAEYGDPFDPMGGGLTHFSAYHKAAQNWFGACGMVTARGDGVFTLAPTELRSSGVQALRVPLAPELCPAYPYENCYYYIEYRQPVGAFDGAEPYASSPMNDGVLVRLNVDVDPTGTSGLTGPFLLDMTPGSEHPFGQFWDASLTADKTFRDQTGVRLRVLSEGAEGVRVAVDVPGANGPITCGDGSDAGDPECSDGVLNQDESDVDCGGSCVPCDAGRVCSSAADCWSGLCEGGVCTEPEPSCEDGLVNGDESDVDCGGSCSPCGNGSLCNTGADCESHLCDDGVCTETLLTGTLQVQSVWQTGYCAQLQLRNDGYTPTSTWEAELRLGDSVPTSMSGAVPTALGGGYWQLTPESWNQTIWPSSHATVSFCAQITGPDYYPELVYVTGN